MKRTKPPSPLVKCGPKKKRQQQGATGKRRFWLLRERERHKRYMKDWRVRNRGKCNLSKRLWKLRHRTKYLEGIARWKKRNRLKVRAWKKVWKAIKRGAMKRNHFCVSCKIKCKTEGHHPNYSKPLQVIWLCTKCHRGLHGQRWNDPPPHNP